MLTKFQNAEDVHRAHERSPVHIHRASDMQLLDSPDYRTFVYLHDDCEKEVRLSGMNRTLALTLRSFNVYTFSTSLNMGFLVHHLRRDRLAPARRLVGRRSMQPGEDAQPPRAGQPPLRWCQTNSNSSPKGH